MNNPLPPFDSLDKLAVHLREKLDDKKYLLLFAYNGTGKTRLSMASRILDIALKKITMMKRVFSIKG